MQAFACKRECDKEASGDDREKGGKERENKETEKEREREVGNEDGCGDLKERARNGKGGGGGWGGGERWDWMGEKKLWRPLVWFVLVLTTLKNRWTLFLNRRDSDYNPHVWFFFFISTFLSLSFAFFPFRHDSGMPPQSQKKKCHTTDNSLMIYTYVYVCIYTLLKALDQKYFSYSFSFSLSVTSWYTGRVEWKSGNVRKKIY